MRTSEFLQEAARRGASDVVISAGAPITYHVDGLLEFHAEMPALSPTESEGLVYQLLNEEQRKRFEQEMELDLSFHYRDVARFRVSVYRQKGTVAAVLRLVPLCVPRYSELGISERLLTQLVGIQSGLVLVTGPTGSGKSTTVASILEYLNTESDRRRHIITIEDPIEFLFPSNVCVVDQREVGRDTRSYVVGLKSALRQMPHVIFVGEMRDRPTMEIALTAAETGNLVISTLSTQSAAKTINRVIDVFPLEDQAEIRARLALSLRAVVSQVLLRRSDRPGRVAAREVMFVTSPVANLIREGKVHQLNNTIASSHAEGMSLLDESLLDLQRRGIVSAAEVVPRLQDADKLREVCVR
ncbi:MAG: PilT/PilU family type 4a pilus ATPase [Candidatus Eisenbacteria bacterium]|nr:PilT/PilU family type 4a pilus ATPase [Candidatus Eisenbacteria bacterium]